MRSFWDAVEALDNQIEAGTQLAMLIEGRRLVERAARWVVRAGPRAGIDVTAMTDRFAPGARILAAALPDVLCGLDRDQFAERRADLEAGGVPAALAHRVASMQALLVGVRHRRRRRHHRIRAAGRSPTSTSASARASGWTGCATGSSSSRAPIAGSRSRARRCATICTACTGRSRGRSCSPRSSTARRSRSRTGWSATPPRWSAPTRCWPTSRPRGSTTPPRCRWCCASCAASSPTPVS